MTSRPSTIAWAALISGILAYEYWAPADELMSASVDRALEKHPVLVRVAFGLITLHLVNLLPKKADPIYAVALVTRRGR